MELFQQNPHFSWHNYPALSGFSLLRVQDVRREERIEFGVEVRVFEVVVADEGEDAAEREHRDHAAHVVRRHQEVGQEEGAGQVRHHLGKRKILALLISI